MIDILNKSGILFLILAGGVIGFLFLVLVVFALVILMPGLFLYYTSLKMKMKKFQGFNYKNTDGYPDEFDENGMKVINSEYQDTFQNSDNKQGLIKKSVTRFRDFLNKYLD